MSKKSLPNLFSNFLFIMGQYFLTYRTFNLGSYKTTALCAISSASIIKKCKMQPEKCKIKLNFPPLFRIRMFEEKDPLMVSDPMESPKSWAGNPTYDNRRFWPWIKYLWWNLHQLFVINMTLVDDVRKLWCTLTICIFTQGSRKNCIFF